MRLETMGWPVRHGAPAIAVCILAAILTALVPPSCPALTRDDILVVANGEAWGSVALAHYYMERRNLDFDRLVRLSLPPREACSRGVYEKLVAEPVREAVKKNFGGGRAAWC
ncbi:MAG: hypothetical protein ACLFOY_11430 [Desulfatibacillaceae bacterium]